MYSSGTSAIVTSGAGSVTLLPLTAGQAFNRLVINNTGAAAGFFSVDNGSTWGYIPASDKVEFLGRSNSSVLMKRAAADMSGVYAYATWIDYR